MPSEFPAPSPAQAAGRAAQRRMRRFLVISGLFWVIFSSQAPAQVASPAVPPAVAPRPLASPRYEFRAEHDPDGIGKFYMGREIAQVMGHQGAAWLERPQREWEEAPQKMLAALGLRPGEVVADIGAGSGYHTFRLAKLVGPKGKVYAVDIQPEMLAIIRHRMKLGKVKNVIPVLGTVTDPRLPAETLDLALLVDVYHEFSHPYEMMDALLRALKPRGRVVFVEFRLEDPRVPIKRLHRMSEEQVRREMTPFPLRHVKTWEFLPWQHLIIFEKVEPAPSSAPMGAPRSGGAADR